MLEFGVVSSNHAFVAVVLLAILAVIAVAARVNEAANTSVITDLKLGHIFADSNNNSGNFVARNHREQSRAPLFASLVNVGVADTSIGNFDVHIVVTNCATLDGVRYERLA